MKTNEILSWIVGNSINGEILGITDVPEVGEEEWQQNEGWWMNQFGGVPPKPVEAGRYMYFYESNIYDALGDPDAEIELPDDYIHLYRIDD